MSLLPYNYIRRTSLALSVSISPHVKKVKFQEANDSSGINWRFRKAWVTDWSSPFLSGPEAACQLSTWSGKLDAVQTSPVNLETQHLHFLYLSCSEQQEKRREDGMAESAHGGEADSAASSISLWCSEWGSSADNRKPSQCTQALRLTIVCLDWINEKKPTNKWRQGLMGRENTH